MARKAGQGKEEEESRARQQAEKMPVRDEEKTPACDGRGHHVVEPAVLTTYPRLALNTTANLTDLELKILSPQSSKCWDHRSLDYPVSGSWTYRQCQVRASSCVIEFNLDQSL
ncbi:hypothetical protein STEG23_013465, partial [Scotinomys teguina]